MSASLRTPTAPPPHHDSAPGAATTLLEAYRPGSDRFLATPGHTLLGSGTRASVPHDSRPLTLRVREVLEAARPDDGTPPIVMGTVPFAPDGVATLAVPVTVRRAGPLRADPLIALREPETGGDDGWQSAGGDGDWVVTIRCAEAEGRTLRLFAGAGVVARSSPEAETAETGAKFRTFLSAVGASL
ncbi:chorismate-binding protein [Streptomyces sp. NPDC051784]|uniref:chorismate-binding protein n=1 Tax=Streptomyces sp. NPDC051784 TaxID=3155805 RepID=UPI003414D98A